MAILTAVKIGASAQVGGLGQADNGRSLGVSWDSGDAITENGAAPVPGRTACPARGPARDTAEPVFGYMDKAVASGTRVG